MTPAPYLHPFRPRLLDSLRGYTPQQFARDAGAGLTVGVVALPLAMAFGIASGVNPEQGIITAIVAGFVISALGGSHVQIGGPAGAFIVIVYGIVQRYGLTNLLIATALAGVLMFVMGLFKLGGLVRYIPVPIIIGFTNGIAVLIALSQLRDLLGLDIARLPADFIGQMQVLARHAHTVNLHALALGVICVASLFAWAHLFKRTNPVASAPAPGRLQRICAHLPGPMVVLVTLSVAAALLGLPVETIGSRFGGIPSGLPALALPPVDWNSARQLVIPTVTIALLGAVESLLCARVADNLADIPRHDPNQELMAQGVANIVTPVFGGIPATGTIARTVTNIRAGGRTPVAGMVHAATLLLIVLAAAPLAAHVPLAVLAGILLFVAWNMAEWHQLLNLRRYSVRYRIVLLGTFALTVVFDLTVAVQVGLVLACAFFIYRMGTLFRAQPVPARDAPAGVLVLELYGPLFFGAVGKFEALAQQLPAGTRAVVLHARRLILLDTSGLEVLAQFHRELQRRGVAMLLAEVPEQPLSLLRRSGFAEELGEPNLPATLPEALERSAGLASAPAG